jgi:MuDR family transposase
MFNAGLQLTPLVMFYTELQLLSNDIWRLMVNHSVQLGIFTMIELYVELKACWNTPNKIFASGSRGHEISNAYVEPISSIIPDASFGTNRNQSVPEEENNIEDLEFNIGLNDINPEERVEKLVSQDTTPIGNTCSNNNFITMNFTPFEDTNYNSKKELHETMTSWPLRDRSYSHPVASWNNIDAIVDIIGDYNYFDDEGYVTEDGLALGQCFWSKDYLKWIVYDFHIKANRTFKKRKSNKSVYTIECTDQNCHWRLYASRRQSDDAFIINTRGILCSHILACCVQWDISSSRYVNLFYRVNELLATWTLEFEPFGNSDTWLEIWRPKLIPDLTRYAVKKGRRQYLRIQNEMDEENTHQTYTCGRCKQPEHNRRTCTAPLNNEGNTKLILCQINNCDFHHSFTV